MAFMEEFQSENHSWPKTTQKSVLHLLRKTFRKIFSKLQDNIMITSGLKLNQHLKK